MPRPTLTIVRTKLEVVIQMQFGIYSNFKLKYFGGINVILVETSITPSMNNRLNTQRFNSRCVLYCRHKRRELKTNVNTFLYAL